MSKRIDVKTTDIRRYMEGLRRGKEAMSPFDCVK
jgi:hypothetical protein